jgi:hypothetical protein
VELLRVEGEGKNGVVMLLRHYARCGITRTSTVGGVDQNTKEYRDSSSFLNAKPAAKQSMEKVAAEATAEKG